MRVLLVEDDVRLAEATAEYLTRHGAEVTIEANGARALERLREVAASPAWDVVLLDLMLPGLDGLEVCRRAREVTNVPIVVVSARGDEVDRVVGLELGADDYLAKPFSPRELLARMKAVLRRAPAPTSASPPSTLALPSGARTVGALHIDRDRRIATLSGKALELTAYPFEVLWALVERAGLVVSRPELHARVRELRGEAPTEYDPSIDRAIDVHVSKVRQALAAVDPDAQRWLKTVRAVGYQLVVGEP
jgi:DNA-binding response OmpR family regulator